MICLRKKLAICFVCVTEKKEAILFRFKHGGTAKLKRNPTFCSSERNLVLVRSLAHTYIPRLFDKTTSITLQK